MDFNKLILMFVIVALSVLSEAKYLAKEQYKVITDYDKLTAELDELKNQNFLKILNNIYMNYEDHRVNAVEKFIVICLKKANDDLWFIEIIDYMPKLVEANLRNEFYIKLLKEMRKQKAIGSFHSEDQIEDVIYRLEQVYADRIQSPSSWILEETVTKMVPVNSPSYKLQFLKTFQADLNKFAKFEEYVEALWKDIRIFSINYDSENTIKAIFVLYAYLDDCTMETNQTASMLLDALMSRFEYLTKADLNNEFYIELLKGLKDKNLIGTYSKYEIDVIIDRLEETYSDKIQKPSLWTHVTRSVYKFFKKYENGISNFFENKKDKN